MKSKTKLQKYRKAKIWPILLVLGLFVAAFTGILVLFLELFVVYTGGMKMALAQEEVDQYGAQLEYIVDKGFTEQQLRYNLQRLFKIGDNAYLVDEDGNEIFHRGISYPNFDMQVDLELSETYVGYADTEASLESLWDIPVLSIVTETLSVGFQDFLMGRWSDEVVFEIPAWLKSNACPPGMELYIRKNISITRKDMVGVCAVGIVGVAAFVITFILLLISLVSSFSAQRKATKLLFYDSETGGKNWFHYQVKARRVLTNIFNLNKSFAVVDFHIMKFRDFCVCYGNDKGELLLADVYRYLAAKCKRVETVSHNSKAAYSLLIQCSDEEECVKKLRTVMADLSGIVPEAQISFEAGVCMIPAVERNLNGFRERREKIDVDKLFTLAGDARVMLNKGGSNRVVFFNQEMLADQLWTREVEDSMERALNNEEFEIYLQPKYSAAGRKLVAAEALIRWKKDGELVPPGKFIPIFEENGSIIKIDDYMISNLSKQMAKWRLDGKKQIPVSVNLSRVHFAQENLAEHICTLVDAYGTEHKYIEIEITESAFFDDENNLIEVINRLHEYGFKIAMDDFGAGFSSLNSLKNLPLDVLKIDMAFFRGQDQLGRGDIIVEEILHLAERLKMETVAEGIEREEQVLFLADKGCDLIQGYYFGKPMPVEEFEKKLEEDG